MNPIITEITSGKGQKAYVQGNPSVYEYGENEAIAISKLLLRLQGKRMSSISGAFVFACAMWASWLVLTWMFIATDLSLDTFNGMAWGVFLLFGIFGSAFATRR